MALEALLAGKKCRWKRRKFLAARPNGRKDRYAAKSIAKWDAEPVKIRRIDAAAVKALAKTIPTASMINVWAPGAARGVTELRSW